MKVEEHDGSHSWLQLITKKKGGGGVRKKKRCLKARCHVGQVARDTWMVTFPGA